MADDTDDAPEQEASRKKATGPIIALVLIVVAMCLGGVMPFLIEAVWKQQEVRAGEGQYEYLDFPETVVNLSDGSRNRYLQITLSLEVEAKEADSVQKKLDAKKVPLQAWMLRYLSGKSLEDISGDSALNRLRTEILDEFNSIMFPGGEELIHDVKFTKVGVQ